MNNVSESVDKSIIPDTIRTAFDFYANMGAALFPIPAGEKNPTGIVGSFARDCTTDRAQWEAWYREHRCNFGIVAGPSGIITVDVDVKEGRNEAWVAYVELCRSWGVDKAPGPQVHTPSGGFHIYFKVPEGADARPLRQPDAVKRIINVRAGNGYTVAAGSNYQGRPYLLDVKSGVLPPPPLVAPAGLVEHCRRGGRTLKPSTMEAIGSRDQGDVARLVTWLAEHGLADEYLDWCGIGMALKLEYGDAGLDLWQLATWPEVPESKIDSHWQSFSTEPKPDMQTLATWLKRAHDAGWRGSVRKSAAAMFDGVAQVAASHPIAPESVLPPPGTPGTTTGVSLTGGSGWVAPPLALEWSESALADRFADQNASQLRRIKLENRWLFWTGTRWRRDDTERVLDLARKHCAHEARLYGAVPGRSVGLVRTLCSKNTAKSVLELAGSDLRIASTPDEWDQEPWLLGTPDGVLDLRTGEHRPACPDDRITKSTAVAPAPSAACPTWLKCLQRITRGDMELQRFLQKMCGYVLTGSTREQVLFFAHGPGNTGKGTFTHTISKILGDYHKETAIETLTESKQDRHPVEIANLVVARLVTCSETEHGRHWAESRIKQWTGGDILSARFMHGNLFQFVPNFKLIISGNYKPRMRPDSAMRRRFRLIPFTVEIPPDERDPNLESKLEAEWPSILAWMVEGCLAWQREGLKPPPVVRDATDEYFEEEAEDVMSMWLRERCDMDPGAEATHSMLYASFRQFAEGAGERNISNRAQFGKDLKRLGFGRDRTKSARQVIGLKLKAPPGPLTQHPRLPPINSGVQYDPR